MTMKIGGEFARLSLYGSARSPVYDDMMWLPALLCLLFVRAE